MAIPFEKYTSILKRIWIDGFEFFFGGAQFVFRDDVLLIFTSDLMLTPIRVSIYMILSKPFVCSVSTEDSFSRDENGCAVISNF